MTRTAATKKPADPITPEPTAEPSISKAQAVRNALAEGIESPGEIADYVKAKHGLELTNQQASLYKSQHKKKSGELAKPGRKPKAESHAEPKALPTGDGALFDALKAMKPLIAQYGPEKVKAMVDLLG